MGEKNGRFLFYSLLLLSFVIVAFGQSVWVGWLCYLSAFFGYSLFWLALEKLKERRSCFWLGTLWFFFVQLVQLSWMSSTAYVGGFMLLVYAFFALLLGLQFGFICLLLPRSNRLKYSTILALASIWTVFEWSRLFILSGWSWNPVGLCLTNNHFSMQMASVLGVYGLSFWVIMVNLIGYKSFSKEASRVKIRVLWAFFFLFPYLFGMGHEALWKSKIKENQNLSVLLLQPALTPDQKVPMPSLSKAFVPAILQWQKILFYLKEYRDKKIDLIVFPEAALPFGADTAFYTLPSLLFSFSAVFDTDVSEYFPDFSFPQAQMAQIGEEEEWRFSNLFWAQTIANFMKAEVVIGLDDADIRTNKNYNAAFHFVPGEKKIDRYEKQILVPLVEYFPFSWCKDFMEKFGITEEFTPGTESKVFQGKYPLAISICYEETIGNIMRNFRRNGASLFINVSNDGWFPSSRLPRQHFEHGKLRSVENGVPIIRACNTGVTGGADSFGRVIKVLTSKDGSTDDFCGALYFQIPLFSYPTLYTFWGDKFILIASFIFIIIFLYKDKDNIIKFIIRRGGRLIKKRFFAKMRRIR